LAAAAALKPESCPGALHPWQGRAGAAWFSVRRVRSGTDAMRARRGDARLMGCHGRARLAIAAGIALAALVAAAPAQATFTGSNGRIAFTWSRGGVSDTGPAPHLVGIVSVRPDGSGRRLIVSRGTEPRYSPAGRRIAFMRKQRLWVARADGKHARPLTPRGWLVGQHQWSRAGTSLAFIRVSRTSPSHALYTVKVDGGTPRRLVKAPTSLSLREGAWSRDGKAIVYTQFRNSGRPLVRVIRSGAITTIVSLGSMPTWSEQGLLAYEAPSRGAMLNRVCIRRPRPGVTERCFGFIDAATTNPVWSPSASHLLFNYTSQVGGGEQTWLVRVDGTVLSRAPGATAPPPVFSPDGTLLALSVMSFRGDPRLGYTDLYVRRPDGSDTRLLVRGGQATAPDWQPRR
jgi:Tol biopolymer transport system component